jgi:hypothetical protein
LVAPFQDGCLIYLNEQVWYVFGFVHFTGFQKQAHDKMSNLNFNTSINADIGFPVTNESTTYE